MTSTSGSQHRFIFVGNIPYDATEEQLIQICEEVGPVVSFRLVLDIETGRSKGYGFCEYKDEETALSAPGNLQGYEINGRQLRVDFAENKGVDRNREQGCGGPGLTLGTDGQKPLAGPPSVGDADLHQPVGLPLAGAGAAASLMAEALGRPQTSNLPQFGYGMQNIPSSGNDHLNAYLTKMSRQQLNEVMSDLKALATKNRAQARQLLQESPQLAKALFQAQIMLGIVPPEMMQVEGLQKTSSSAGKISVQDNKQNLDSVAPYLGYVTSNKEISIETLLKSSEALEKNVIPNAVVFQHSSLPPKHTPLHACRPPVLQNQISVQETIPGIVGLAMHSNIQAQPLPSYGNSFSQVQPSMMHHSRPLGNAPVVHETPGFLAHTSMQQSVLPPLTSQAAKVLANLITLGSGIVGRAMFQAYHKAIENANKTGLAHETIQNISRSSKVMSEQEARLVLGISEQSTWEETVEKYNNMFERNTKNGSLYLQSMVQRAKECLEAVYLQKANQGEQGKPLQK